jgi:hypothetical protein
MILTPMLLFTPPGATADRPDKPAPRNREPRPATCTPRTHGAERSGQDNLRIPLGQLRRLDLIFGTALLIATLQFYPHASIKPIDRHRASSAEHQFAVRQHLGAHERLSAQGAKEECAPALLAARVETGA